MEKEINEERRRKKKTKSKEEKTERVGNDGQRAGLVALRASSCAGCSLRIVGNAACTMFRETLYLTQLIALYSCRQKKTIQTMISLINI